MAVAHVQHDWDFKVGAGTSFVYNSGLTVTTGHLIIVYTKYAGTAGSVTVTVTDNFSNTYTQTPGSYLDSGDDTFGLNRSAIFYAKNITGGANYTITLTFSASIADGQAALEFDVISGADATTPFAGEAQNAQANPGTGTDAITSTAFTPTAAGCYVYGAFGGGQSSVIVNAGTGFTGTVAASGATAAISRISTEYLIQGAAASVAAEFTCSSASLVNTNTRAAAFKPSGGANVYSLACDGSSYAVTGADATGIHQAIQTWLRVGR